MTRESLINIPAANRRALTDIPPSDDTPRLADSEKRAVLAALATTGTITKAAERANVAPVKVRGCIKADHEFGTMVREVMAVFADSLEDEAIRRAVAGITKDIYHQGEVVGHEQIYSDRLMEKLLAGRRPEIYGRQSLELSGPGGGPIQIEEAKGKLLSLLGEVEDGEIIETPHEDVQ